jgi:hypothetical protein
LASESWTPKSDARGIIQQENRHITTGTSSLAPEYKNKKTEGSVITHIDPTLVFIISIAALLMKL